MEQIAKLFIMIFMGYVVVKMGLLKDEDSKVLSTLVLYLIVPCVILNAFQVDYTPEKVSGLELACIASLLLLFILLPVVNLIGKVLKLNEVETMSIYYSNSGNLIVPLVAFMLGDKWVFYACVFMGLQTIFFWTHCKKVLSHEKGFNLKKIFFNINIITIIIAITLFFAKIRLPEIITGTLSSVGAMIGPASMFVIGMLIGGMLPFLFSAMTMSSISRAAYQMIEEVRRQFREKPGIMKGTEKPDYKSCVAISTTAALHEMMLPGIMAVVVPVIVGVVLGVEALGGLLSGALVTGVLMAIFMSNAGGAWDNAKKYIETGHHGGKGSEAHKAAVVGDTVGDPFKDTSGPSINILIKLMTVVSLVFAPLFLSIGGLL